MDSERLAWLIKHVTYLEHTDKNGVSAHKAPLGGYWPQQDTGNSSAIEEYIDLNLIDYIDAQIKEGNK